MMRLMRGVVAGVLVGVVGAGVGLAQVAGGELARQIDGMLADPAVARAHWGIAVVGMDGAPIYLRNEGELFQPASNAKLFTTAAAMALLGPERRFETRVVAKGRFLRPGTWGGDLYLVGDGDANLSGREIPYVEPKDRPKALPGAPLVEVNALRHIEELADQVVRSGIKRVDGNVIGDDTLFPRDPYPEDWAVDDVMWGYGAPVSALVVNDNQMKVTVTPGAREGMPATVKFDPAVRFYEVRGYVQTTKVGSGRWVNFSREPGSRMFDISGSIAAGSQPESEEVAVSEPALFAAEALKRALEAKGVVVAGRAGERRLEQLPVRGFVAETREPIDGLKYGNYSGYRLQSQFCFASAQCATADGRVVASHESPRVAEDVVVTNKVSQNLHAELMLHQLAVAYGKNGSTAQGARVVRQFLLNAGVDGDDFVFFDGSGLSGHDLVTPRAVVRLLQYAAGQPWFVEWKQSLPVGGVDGSLESRFGEAAIDGKVFAKTGTTGEARALSGYLECASGRTVMFSILVNNHAPHTSVDREVMDRIVGAIAAAE
jgi:D-alanyl-D-alanine carboxypeptidase/D-alanyl-D-alanine-endopeptidase (penicillin-binding protein 4)